MRSLTRRDNQKLSMKIKALFVEKINHGFKISNGTDQASGLSNCINHFVNSLDGVKKTQVDRIDGILLNIAKWNPSKIIIQGLWLTPNDVKSIKMIHKDLDIWVQIHSNVPFLVSETVAFSRFKEYQDLGVGIIFNSLDAHSLCNLWRSVYLPNLYHRTAAVPLRESLAVRRDRDEFLNIGCFGSMRPLKNQVAQALASINAANQLKKRLRFHVNYNRSEGGMEVKKSLKDVFRLNPNHQMVCVPWLSQADFIKYNAEYIDVGLQVSLSETFNLVSADYVSAGVPMCVSREVYWAHESSFVDTHSLSQIEWKIEELVETSNNLENSLCLNNHQSNALARWGSFLET